jgi:hypothetical protein
MMSQFCYYIPGRKRVSPDELKGLGLAYAFDSAPACREVTSGPGTDGKHGPAGVVFSADASPGYYPESQAWLPVPGTTAWAGLCLNDMPKPSDLAREASLTSYTAPLGDGHTWSCPVVTNKEKSVLLPMTYSVNEAGEIIKVHNRKYDALLCAAYQVWDLCDHNAIIDEEKEVEIASTALSANYRVGIAELALMQVLDVISIKRIFMSLIDIYTWNDEEGE